MIAESCNRTSDSERVVYEYIGAISANVTYKLRLPQESLETVQCSASNTSCLNDFLVNLATNGLFKTSSVRKGQGVRRAGRRIHLRGEISLYDEGRVWKNKYRRHTAIDDAINQPLFDLFIIDQVHQLKRSRKVILGFGCQVEVLHPIFFKTQSFPLALKHFELPMHENTIAAFIRPSAAFMVCKAGDLNQSCGHGIHGAVEYPNSD